MVSPALTAPAPPGVSRVRSMWTRALSASSAGIRMEGVDWALVVAMFVLTFTKLYWKPLGKLDLTFVTAWIFIAMFCVRRWAMRDWRVPREVAVAGVFALGFVFVYIGALLGIDTHSGDVQFVKEFVTRVTHIGFMLCMAAHLAERGRAYVGYIVRWMLAGMAVNAIYGAAQLGVFVVLHANLDAMVLTPLRFSLGGSRGIQYFGGNLYRINALMRDPNHLGVTLAVPFAIVLAWLRGMSRTLLAAGFLFVALLTLSRSGGVAFVAALVVLAAPLGRRLVSWKVIAAIVVFALAIAAFAVTEPTLWQQVVVSRFNTSGNGTQTHIGLYTLVPQMLAPHALFGNGLNSFALIFQTISGRTGFGPHSMYIQTLVETGMLGFALTLAWFAYLLTCAYRVRTPLTLGIGAALIATWAGNAFYLTSENLYVEVLYAFALSAPFVFRSQLQSERHADRHPHPQLEAPSGAATHAD